ncbi:MAG: hypothetical protein ACREOO_07570 [bacterium]
MKNENYKKQNGDKITSGLIRQDNLAMRTLHFVREQLPLWRDDPERTLEVSETRLNSQLCDFLDSHANRFFPMVHFKHEERQTGRSSVDLSAKLVQGMALRAKQYTIYDSVLVFECKRLPAPSSDREMEYVTGGKNHRSGGIQRFKLGVHGAELNMAVMIGYVQAQSARDWYNKINAWISELCNGTIEDECIWNDGETLEQLDEDEAMGFSNYRSVHSRADNTSNNRILIHHLWIEMNPHQI